MIYSYWRNMSNSTGSNTVYIFVGWTRTAAARADAVQL